MTHALILLYDGLTQFSSGVFVFIVAFLELHLYQCVLLFNLHLRVLPLILLQCCLCYLQNSFCSNLLSLTLKIRIDGQDISEVTLDSLRKSIGVVPQDTVKLGRPFKLHFTFSSCMFSEQLLFCLRYFSMTQYSTTSIMAILQQLQKRSAM